MISRHSRSLTGLPECSVRACVRFLRRRHHDVSRLACLRRLEVGTRRILHWNATEHLTAEWTAQQFRTIVRATSRIDGVSRRRRAGLGADSITGIASRQRRREGKTTQMTDGWTCGRCSIEHRRESCCQPQIPPSPVGTHFNIRSIDFPNSRRSRTGTPTRHRARHDLTDQIRRRPTTSVAQHQAPTAMRKQDRVLQFIPPHDTKQFQEPRAKGVRWIPPGNVYAAQAPISRPVPGGGLTKCVKAKRSLLIACSPLEARAACRFLQRFGLCKRSASAGARRCHARP